MMTIHYTTVSNADHNVLICMTNIIRWFLLDEHYELVLHDVPGGGGGFVVANHTDEQRPQDVETNSTNKSMKCSRTLSQKYQM
jgi:hypothetical protein